MYQSFTAPLLQPLSENAIKYSQASPRVWMIWTESLLGYGTSFQRCSFSFVIFAFETVSGGKIVHADGSIGTKVTVVFFDNYYGAPLQILSFS